MPQLYDFDDYDRCLQEYGAGTYCFVRAEVQPNSTAAAWRAIQEISKYDRHHFDHRQLYFGLCLHKCEAQLAELDANARQKLQPGLLTDNAKVNTNLYISINIRSDREKPKQPMLFVVNRNKY